MTDDPVADLAQAVARRLTTEFGPRTGTEVEAALAARDGSRGVSQYDPMAVGALIVAIAQLAWSVYTDHRKKAPDAAPEVSERVLRTEIRRDIEITPASARITEIVVQEIVSENHRSLCHGGYARRTRDGGQPGRTVHAEAHWTRWAPSVFRVLHPCSRHPGRARHKNGSPADHGLRGAP